MNGTQTTQIGTRRTQPYDDTLFQMMGKGFSDKSTRSAQPPHSSTSSLPPHNPVLDQYSQMRTATSSNVFDPSEFPSLGGGLGVPPNMSVNPAALLNSSAPLDVSGLSPVGIPGVSVNGLGPYADMYNIASYGDGRAKAVDAVTGASGSSEFNMQSEDFPALGGNPASGALRASNLMGSVQNGPSLLSSTGRGQANALDSGRQAQDEYSILTESESRQQASQLPTNDASIPNGESLGMTSFAPNGSSGKLEAPSSILRQVADDNHDDASKNSQSKILPADQYGMKGLLKYVGPRAEGTDMNMLSVGVDLTSLGLDFMSSEPLYKSFSSPWEGGQGGVSGDLSGSSRKNEEPDYKLPTCYYMQPPALKNSHFTKFQLETLFYVFYNMPRDILQVLAAIELYNRKWMYHKDLKLWFTCEPEVLQSYERGAYIYFDIKSWEQRPFHDANQSFIQGLMTEDEVRSVPLPGPRSTAS